MQLLALPVQEADERWVPAWSAALDAEDTARAARFVRAADRTRFIAAHALLRTVLGALTGRDPASLVVAQGPHGKPFLPGYPALHFNLTHTAGLTAVALHASDIGCDAEPAGRKVADTVFSMMAPEEQSWLLGLDPGPVRQKAFIRLWVVKEAFVKALGLGLVLDPRRYAFDVSDGAIRLSRAPAKYADGAWNFFCLRAGPDHVAAVAVRGPLAPAAAPVPQFISAETIARAAAGCPLPLPRPA